MIRVYRCGDCGWRSDDPEQPKDIWHTRCPSCGSERIGHRDFTQNRTGDEHCVNCDDLGWVGGGVACAECEEGVIYERGLYAP